MRLSRYFLPILKETPREAEIVSHRLMLRAGMIRQQAAGHLLLAAARQARAGQGLPDRARGAGPRRRARDPDADHPVGRPVARKRPLRRLRQGDAAHQGPARARHALRPDQRGDGHRDLPLLRQVLQGPAAQPLPYPVEVPRRGAAALRRHALARVPDEGRLFLRPRLRRRQGCLQPHVRGLSAHLHAHGPEGDPDARRYRADRRRSQPRVHHPGRHRREPGLSATATSSTLPVPGEDTDFADDAEIAGIVDDWTTPYAATDEMHDEAAWDAIAGGRPASRRAASRSATSSTSATSIPSRWAPR